MTCIVGIAKENVVYIGGERSASDESTILSACRPKVGIRGDWLYGFSGSYGTGQLIEFIALPKVLKNDDPYTVLRMAVVEELKKAYDAFGRDLEDNSSSWLIGCKGRLFELSSGDWGVVEVEESSIGSGNTIALGSLHTTKQFSAATPDMRIQWALDAAITISPTCLGPVDILSL